MTDEEAPGWAAIDGALARIYGDTEPLHFAPQLPMMLGGDDPLNGISAFRSTFGGRAHWHFVSYGYSELFEKESDDLEVSGYGFEMTIRVIDPEAIDEPPGWVLSLLQNLARYVFRTGNHFEAGHYTTLNGPIALERDTQLVAALFIEDPELGSIETPNGAVSFLQLVGITADEYDAARGWDSPKMAELFREKDPALLTDLLRPSKLNDPELARRVEEGTTRDGSSMGAVYSTRGSLDEHVWEIAANLLPDVGRLLRGRVAFERTAFIYWPEGGMELGGAKVTGVRREDPFPVLELSPEDQRAVLALPIKRGDYPLPSGLVVRIVPTPIYDGERKKVLREIG